MALLSMAIADSLGLYEFEKSSLLEYALVHDALEAWTGDIASPVNQMIDHTRWPIKRMMGKWWHLIKIQHQRPKNIVKVADMAEAIKYLDIYGKNAHAERVKDDTYSKLKVFIEDKFKDKDQEVIWAVVKEFFSGRETYIDDYIE